jgi:hypothetical protein
MSAVFPSERIEQTILLLRGHKIILDRDLAAMYGVSTRDLNNAVSRNLDRFPDDFILQLTRLEFNDLKFQFGTSGWGGCRVRHRIAILGETDEIKVVVVIGENRFRLVAEA